MWTGLILAGGAASRMGRDKALLEIGGRALLRRAVDLVRSGGGEPVVIGPRRPGVALGGVRFLDEAPDGARRGPLSALRFGLRETGAPLVVALACDLPLLTGALLRRLVRDAPGWDAVVPRAAGRLQVLSAAWTGACLPAMDALLASGEGALYPVVERVRARILEEADLADCGGPGMFLNLNGPEDVARAAALLGEGA